MGADRPVPGGAPAGRLIGARVGTPWDARTYDVSSAPQQSWASEVLERLEPIAPDARVSTSAAGPAS